MLDQRLSTSPANTADLIPSLALFQHVQEQQRLFQAFLRGQGIRQTLNRGQGFRAVTQAFQDLLRRRMEQRLREESKRGESDELLAAVASYLAGAFMTLMQWWLETELAWSPERMDALFRDLVLPGVDYLLNQEPQAARDNGAEHAKSRASPLTD